MSNHTPSVALSVRSITASEVSQVDFKLRANNTKNKLKALLKSVDSDKSGFIKYEVFFPMLELHNVELSTAAITYLKRMHSKNSAINYKDAINQLTIDLQAAAGTDPEQRNGTMKWTLFALQKKEDQVNLDEKNV